MALDRSLLGVVQDSLVGSAVDRSLEALYRTQGARMWRSVLAYAGDPGVADDAVAEAFAQALRRGEAIRDPAGWVWRAAFRLAAGELARRRKTTSDPPVERLGYEMSEPAVDLVRALGRLSPKQRGCVVLHHYAGHPLKDVALIVDSTVPAVKVHLHRGRARLRELLEDDDD